MEENKICPYPGLRPFNDDESIFFRGRDRNIDTIIELFEKKKFMMLTGASGDGKSSLVYAGVVPRARAGLFKAKYNNWAVADFRPERTPLDNLSIALNKHLKFESEAQLKEEISKGFSSLIRAYKNSPLYIENKDFSALDEKQQKLGRRKAANLLIIADQFEEFFTNAENFSNGKASVESQTVINILLETAKTALAEDIPVYVICTMRSDYIGQCAAFRGLPEYIGFSQFFVPRLKRLEIQQVIEEPAILNGDTVSERLVQRLLFDISDGHDQLPILQHALNQIWKIAGQGEETLDLIHYAKAGGLSADELPAEQREEFRQWLFVQPEFKKRLFEKPSLENILNAHANELLESAYDEVIIRHVDLKEKLNPELTRLIIKTTFQCLTKIDASRAVRNRMTIQEISDIINHPSVDDKVVGRILDIFRAQGNTFIKPFITEDPRSIKTHKHTVLDITHESLIRNWDLLNSWAFEEYDNLLNFQDFNKQLQRWIKAGQTSGYLLPIGPLTFFENWYKTSKPNKYWLARYDDRDLSAETKVAEGQETVDFTDTFIRKSAARLYVTRTVMKYGANRIITVFGLLMLLLTCTYYYLDYLRKQDACVIEQIEQEGRGLLLNNKVKIEQKADFVIAYERLHKGTFQSLLTGLKNDTLAFDIAYRIFRRSENFDSQRQKPNPFIQTVPVYLAEVLERMCVNKELIRNDRFYTRYLDFVRLGEYLNRYQADTLIAFAVEKNLDRLYNDFLIPRCRTLNRVKVEDIRIFYSCLESGINHGKNKAARALEILSKITPFESDSSKWIFDDLFPRNKSIKMGDYSFTHNAGYQLLANLYAIAQKSEMVIRCLDSIAHYNPDYNRFEDQNFNQVATYIFDQKEFSNAEISAMISKYATLFKTDRLNWIQQFIIAMDGPIFFYPFSQAERGNPYTNPFDAISVNRVNAFFDYAAFEIAAKNLNRDEYNFRMALLYKQKGLFRGTPKSESNAYFDRALDYLRMVSPAYLKAEQKIGRSNATDIKDIARAGIFFYPVTIDERYGWRPFNLWRFEKSKEVFLNWQIERKLFSSDFYDAATYHYWSVFLTNYYDKFIVDFNEKLQEANYKYYDITEELIRKNKVAATHIDSNFIFLVQSQRYFISNDTLAAFSYLNRIDTNVVFNAEFQKAPEVKGDVNRYLIRTIAAHLAQNGKSALSMRLIQSIQDPFQKRNALLATIHRLVYSSNPEHSFPYLDSMMVQIDKDPKFGLLLFEALGRMGGDGIMKMAANMVKEVKDESKPRALNLLIKGISSNGNYYKALGYVPAYLSSNSELALKTEILKAEISKRETPQQASFFYTYDLVSDWRYQQIDFEPSAMGVFFVE